uniref:Uncharacterized protein n=1 Tax=Romanomermis culicivorax TaxID=13658 RepID=A0A915JQ55_ROMCU
MTSLLLGQSVVRRFGDIHDNNTKQNNNESAKAQSVKHLNKKSGTVLRKCNLTITLPNTNGT